MKTIYELTIRDASLLPSLLTEIISKHNKGLSKVDLDVLESYIKADAAAYPSLKKDIIIEDDNNGTLRVWEVFNGRKLNILYSIMKITIHELSETTTDNLLNEN